MGGISFQLIFRQRGRIAFGDAPVDFTEPFLAIIRDWAERNVDKFERAMGQEDTGVQQAADNFWEPLGAGGSWRSVTKADAKKAMLGMADTLTAYQKAKRRAGYPDWLMVRTGSLATALSNPDTFAQFVGANQAAFGVPLDTETAEHAAFNWAKRQAIYLDESDKLNIRKEFKDFMDYGPGYAASKNRVAAFKYEEERIYRDFQDAVGDEA